MAIVQPRRKLRKSTQSDDWHEFHGMAMTEAEFLDLDDAEETDLEFADGFALEKAVVDRSHGNLTGRIGGHFFLYQRRYGGEFGPERRMMLRLNRHVKPDEAYWVVGAPIGDDAIPTVAVEVRSRSATMAEQRRKCVEYLVAGVREVWLVDPVSRTVEVFEQADRPARVLRAGDTLTSTAMPGFELPLADLFSAID